MEVENYKEYLATRVLSDAQPITYRLLSRALKTNVNTAKQMLYEFYTKQNARKPKSIHATYLLTGKKRTVKPNDSLTGLDGGDFIMRSSPFMSSMPDMEDSSQKPPIVTSILLAREEELENAKNEFDEITSMHIYSLEPGPLKDINLLVTCNQEIESDHCKDNALERWKIYGCIRNSHVKQRTTKNKATTTKPASKTAAKPTAKPAAKPATAPKEAKKEVPVAAPGKESPAQEESKSGRPTPQPGPATLKRSDSKTKAKKDTSAGDLFKSFAKAKPKAKEAEKSKDVDEPMQGMSEDEGDDDDDDEPIVKVDEEKAAAAKKAREEREKKLQDMMDADVDMPDAPVEEEKDTEDAPIDKLPPSKPVESEATVTVQDGRRRGRRRVMKKKKVKDEDGYLVTKEEAVWESFSEDEPEPKKLKPTPKPTTAKGKKGPAKGQGSIASFFKKA